jgi:hypothetical protein
LVGWHVSSVSLPPSDVILAQHVCPLSDITFYLHSESTNRSHYKHCTGFNNDTGLKRKYWLQKAIPAFRKTIMALKIRFSVKKLLAYKSNIGFTNNIAFYQMAMAFFPKLLLVLLKSGHGFLYGNDY